MKPGPLIMLILGIVLTLFGAAVLAGGAAAALGNAAQGRDGFWSSQAETLSTESYALINSFDSPTGASTDTTSTVDPNVVSIRLEATSTTGDDVFVGLGPTAAVEEYLTGVHHTEVTDVEMSPFRVRYLDVPGSGRPAQPATQDFWIESASGPGQQSITTSWQPGSFSVVVMNADASQAVSVEVWAGARIDILGPIATALLWAGVLTVLVGLLLLILGIVGLARGSSKNGTPPPVGAGAPVPDRPRYPAG